MKNALRLICILLVWLTLAFPVAAVTVEQKLTTRYVDTSNCNTPEASSLFANSDGRIYLWFLLNGTQTGDRLRVEWIAPGGSINRAASYNPLDSGGRRCFYDSLLIADLANRTGQWSIRLYYNDGLLFTLTFTLLSLDHTLTRFVDPNNQCPKPAVADIFANTEARVYVWFNVSGVAIGDRMKAEWYDPTQQLYSSFTWSPLTFSGTACYSGWLSIGGAEAANRLGNWSVGISHNDTPLFSRGFNLVAERHNQLLAFQVSGDGRFNAGAAPDPQTGFAGTNSYGLMFRWPSAPGTSFTSFRIDGHDSIYGTDGTPLETPVNLDAKTNRSRWRIGDIEFTQVLQLAFNNQTGREDIIKIAYTMRNTGTVTRQVGGRVLIDTDINQNDGVPFRVSGVGIVKQEREFAGTDVPDSFQAFFDVTDTRRVTVSTLKSGGATAPDRLVLGSWPKMFDTLYDYAIDSNLDFTNDSAYAVYWLPRPLAPGESRGYTTFYGLSAVQVNLEPPLALGVSGPAALSVVNNAYSPDPFDVVATVYNNGSGVANNVQLTLNLPNGLGLASGAATVSLGQVAVGQERQVSWRVATGARTGAGAYTYSVMLTAANAPTKTVARTVTLPQLIITNSLSGTVGIWDGAELWKLNGNGVIVQVTAENSQTRRTETVTDGAYLFSNLPAGSYKLSAKLEYIDEVNVSNVIILPPPLKNGGCQRKSLVKDTQVMVNTVEVQGNKTVNLDFPPPIVMVHGVKSCYEKWYSTEVDAQTKYWDNFVRARGGITFTPNYVSYLPTSWPQRAKQLQNQIEYNFGRLSRDIETRHRYPAWFLVAHSMGGLTARALVYQNEAVALTAALQKLYLLGTPNSGAYGRWYAYYFPFGSELNNWRLSYPLFGYLSEEAITTRFNQEYRSFKDKRVTVFAGNADSINSQPSDGVVREHSVYHIELKNNVISFDNLSPITFQGKTFPREHDELGSLATLKPILVDEILPEIMRLSPPRSAVVNQEWQETEGAAQVQADLNSAHSAVTLTASGFGAELKKVLVEGQALTAAQRAAHSFTIGATDVFTFSPLVLNGTATFTLTAPAGRVISFNAPPLDSAEKTSDEFGETLLVRNPTPGQWQLNATAGTAAAAFIFLVQENSPVGFVGAVKESQVALGKPATLLARLEGAVQAASVSGRLVNEVGETVETLTLFDDGQHQDGSQNDGVFGTVTQPLRTSGRYYVAFTAQAFFNGLTCSRQTEAFVDVLPAGRLLTGQFSDMAFDADNDNRLETLRFTAVFSALSAGSYLVSGDLLDAQGFRVAHAVGQVEANAAGSFAAKLDFNLAGAFCQQFAGAFSIQNLTLTSGADFMALDVWSEKLNTQRYDGVTFNCSNNFLTPRLRTVQPATLFPGNASQVVISGNGLANGVRVSFGGGVTVSSVTWLNSELLVAQVNVAANAASGPREVTVNNPDGRSSAASSLFSVASDQPPTVALSSLSNQQSVRGTITVSASAADDRGIQKVEFYLDSQLVTSDAEFPYQFVWQTTSTSNGNHVLVARAYDTAGQARETQLTVTVNNATIAVVSAASYATTGGLPAQSIAALFGGGMAGSTQVASTSPLPTDLGGVKVRVKDALGMERDAPLFFVSAGQINFLVPEATSNGAATLTVLRDGIAVGQGNVMIEAVAPGLFAANANAQGVAAASVLRVKANGALSYESIARLNQAGTAWEPVPIDLGPEGEQVFLVAYGTGFRNRSALTNATATLGGANVELLYVGAQGELVGLDQANIRIPRSFIGRGLVNVGLTVDGKAANTVTLKVQ